MEQSKHHLQIIAKQIIKFLVIVSVAHFAMLHLSADEEAFWQVQELEKKLIIEVHNVSDMEEVFSDFKFILACYSVRFFHLNGYKYDIFFANAIDWAIDCTIQKKVVPLKRDIGESTFEVRTKKIHPELHGIYHSMIREIISFTWCKEIEDYLEKELSLIPDASSSAKNRLFTLTFDEKRLFFSIEKEFFHNREQVKILSHLYYKYICNNANQNIKPSLLQNFTLQSDNYNARRVKIAENLFMNEVLYFDLFQFTFWEKRILQKLPNKAIGLLICSDFINSEDGTIDTENVDKIIVGIDDQVRKYFFGTVNCKIVSEKINIDIAQTLSGDVWLQNLKVKIKNVDLEKLPLQNQLYLLHAYLYCKRFLYKEIAICNYINGNFEPYKSKYLIEEFADYSYLSINEQLSISPLMQYATIYVLSGQKKFNIACEIVDYEIDMQTTFKIHIEDEFIPFCIGSFQTTLQIEKSSLPVQEQDDFLIIGNSSHKCHLCK